MYCTSMYDNCIEGSICIIAEGRKIQTIRDSWFKGDVQQDKRFMKGQFTEFHDE
jgi:hypothetical protein